MPPSTLRQRERARRLKRSRGAGALARFFTKQALWFVALAFALVIVDAFLYLLIATQEIDREFSFGTPASITQKTSEQLALSEGSYVLGEQAAALLDEQSAWAQLVDPSGQVVWSYAVPAASRTASAPDADGGKEAGQCPPTDTAVAQQTPADDEPATGQAQAAGAAAVEQTPAVESASPVANGPDDPAWGTVPSSYTMNEIALVAHYGRVNGYPSFIWDRDDGLLIVGFPTGAYETMTITWPEQTWSAIPGYIAMILGMDLLILFTAYLVYRRRTQRAVEPINEALDALSRGGRAQLDLKDDLQPVADQINETSDVLERKDRAREQWIRGVSHDIRTPLSMIIVKAEALSSAPEATDAVRNDARAIRTQGMKISDLVADLNAASQLSFDPDPLHIERLHLPKLLRALSAGYLNSGFDAVHPLEFQLDPRCIEAAVMGDARLLARMVENLLSNARLHNPKGCSIVLSCVPGAAEGMAAIIIADDGAGASPAELKRLRARLEHARENPDEAAPDDSGHGLGLVLVDRIARAHGGSFEAFLPEKGGFLARVELPLA